MATNRSTSSTRAGSLAGERRQEPGRAVEEVGGARVGAAGRTARKRVTGDKPRVLDAAARPRFVEPTSVTVASADAAASTSRVVAASDADRHRDDDELGARDRLGERAGRRVEGLRARRLARASPRRRPSPRPVRRRRASRRGRRRRRAGRCRRSRASATARRRPAAAAGGPGAAPPRSSCFITSSTAREHRLRRALGQRPCICGTQLPQELRLALCVDQRRARSPACAR